MENPLRAPHPGRITGLRVAPATPSPSDVLCHVTENP